MAHDAVVLERYILEMKLSNYAFCMKAKRTAVSIAVFVVFVVCSPPTEGYPACDGLFRSVGSTEGDIQLLKDRMRETQSYAILQFVTEAERAASESMFQFILQNRKKLLEARRSTDDAHDKRNSQGVIRDFSLLPDESGLLVKSLTQKADELLRAGFPDRMSRKYITDVQLRWANDDIKGLPVERWHVDHGGFSAIIILKGQGTEVYQLADDAVPYLNQSSFAYGEKYLSGVVPTAKVPVGSLFVLSGSETDHVFSGYKPTFHRTPEITEDRLIIVIRYTSFGERHIFE